MVRNSFPDNKRFAFTIIDDTDVATVANVRPIYEMLERLGMRTTKTVWPVGCPEGSKTFGTSQTLEDAEYREFVLGLHSRGFEITWHGPTMKSSRRPRIEAALESFRETFGFYPDIHINHAQNRDNVYWGSDRLDDPLLKWISRRILNVASDGHREDTPYWWGDLCRRHIVYSRNFTFRGINTGRYNPSMPYRDPRRTLVPWWFSASDAEGVKEFNDLLHPDRQERLEREGGVCIVATHLGKGFVKNGRVHPVTRERLEMLAARPGWFPTVGELLDWLRSQRESELLPRGEWRRMQWAWAAGVAREKWDRWRNRRLRSLRKWRKRSQNLHSRP